MTGAKAIIKEFRNVHVVVTADAKGTLLVSIDGLYRLRVYSAKSICFGSDLVYEKGYQSDERVGKKRHTGGQHRLRTPRTP